MAVDQSKLSKAFTYANTDNIIGLVATAVGYSLIINIIIGLSNNWWGETELVDRIKDFGYGMSISVSLWVTCAFLNNWLSRTVGWLERPWSSFFMTVVANVTVVSFVTVLVNISYLMVVFNHNLAGAWARFSVGQIFFSVAIALFITAIYQGAFFLQTWKQSLVQTEQLKAANLSAKYETLNAQINPHFLFNSLNVLSALVKQDPDKAEQFIKGLSEVYRYVLDVRKHTLVSLSEELEVLEAYVKLIKTRFGDRVQVKVADELSTQAKSQQIVPLSLQMLIENAVKHNGATTKNPLVIELFSADNKLVVRNNLVRSFDSPEGKGLGLENIKERYKLASSQEVEVAKSDSHFSVSLPQLHTTTQAYNA